MKIAIVILSLVVLASNIVWIVAYLRTKKRLEREKTAIANFYKTQLVNLSKAYEKSVETKASYRNGNHSSDIEHMASVVQNYATTEPN